MLIIKPDSYGCTIHNPQEYKTRAEGNSHDCIHEIFSRIMIPMVNDLGKVMEYRQRHEIVVDDSEIGKQWRHDFFSRGIKVRTIELEQEYVRPLYYENIDICLPIIRDYIEI